MNAHDNWCYDYKLNQEEKEMNKAIYSDDFLELRFFSESELTDTYRSWFYDKEVTRYNSHGLFPYTKAQSEQFLKDITEGSESNIVFAIYAKKHYETKQDYTDPIHIGNVSLQRISFINRSAEIAWVIGDKRYWGQGYATRAGNFVLDHAFKRFNLFRIWTGIVAENTGMRKVASKLGMVLEGGYRDAVFLNGRYRDINSYAILETERANDET